MKLPALSRRQFIKLALGGAAATTVVGLTYSTLEASWIQTPSNSIAIPRLPSAFRGARIAFLSDIHHGPFTGIPYIRAIVTRTLALKPDLILLGGDYIHTDARYIKPCFDQLSALAAPLGVFGVLGNHDHYHGAAETSAAMQRAGIVELTNTGVWLEKSAQRVRLAGVGDFWEDIQDLDAALGDITASDACVLLSHNPDYAETINDTRPGLILSGHTHGGQVVLPLIGAPIIPSRYGQKYAHGLVAAPTTQVFVSRGLGTITPPVRFRCRPEINLITLT
jgi:predicted MPP superfamily phosphohydrolase